MAPARTLLIPALLGLVTIGAAACQPEYASLHFSLASSPPVPVSVRDHAIELPVGVAVLVRVEPISDNNTEYVETDRVELTAADASVLGVAPGSKERYFVLTGREVGETCVEVYVEGRLEDCIDAMVVE